MKTRYTTHGWRFGGRSLCSTLAKNLAALVWLATGYALVAQPIITTQPRGASVSLGASLGFSVVATTTSPPLTYQWQLEGTNLPEATLSTLTLQNITLEQEGTYTVVVTDSVGSSTSNPAVLDIDPTFIFATRELLGDDSFLRSDAYRPFPFWVDYDADGWLEMVVSSADQGSLPLHNAIYENNRDGTFTRITNGLALVGARWSGPNWADYDRDGDLDCLFGQWQPDPHVMFFNQQSQGTADFIPVPIEEWISDGAQTPAGLNASAVDYDNDGWTDLAFTWWLTDGGRIGTNLLLHNVGGQFEPVTNTPFALSNQGIEWPSWVDYDDDGDVDFFGATSGGRLEDILFQNQGAGRFVQITNHVLVNQATRNIMGGWGDYDNDGDFDVFLPMWASNPSVLYRNVGGGQFERDEQAPTAAAVSSLWGDYDNDGDLDLIVAQGTIRNRLFNNDGTGRLTEVWVGNPTGLSVSNYVGCWADYNNDGFLDLLTISFIRRDELYLNNLPQTGNQNHWLKVQLNGIVSNPNGLGAKIRVQAAIGGRSVRQTRQIGIWTMFGNDLLAHFGLGDATQVEVLRIEWPSGIVQEIEQVGPDQALTVTEPAIGVEPRTIATSPGSNITVSVVWSNAAPISYQWHFNGTSIEGATSATLELTDVQPTQTGRYTVEMVDGLQRVISQPVQVTVKVYPVILSQPQNLTVTNDSPAIFSVVADSPFLPFSYQWRFNGLPLANETSDTLTIPSAQAEHDGSYDVVVSDALASVTSTPPAQLTVLLKPSITQLVTDYTVVQGGNLTMSIEAEGTLPITYFWRRNFLSIRDRQTNYSHQSFFTLTNVQPTEDHANGTYYVVTLVNSNTPSPGTRSAEIHLTVLPDTDGDGMDNAWEIDHGLNPNDSSDARLDNDSDGHNNREEYDAGTNPANSNSQLKVERIAVNGEVRVEFLAASNKTYTVQFTNVLVDPPSTNWPTLSNVVAGPARTVVVTEPASTPQRFYRIVTPRTPND